MKLPSKSPSILSENKAFSLLRASDQGFLLKEWQALSGPQKESLIRQIAHLDLFFFKSQQEEIIKEQKPLYRNFQPFIDYSLEGNSEDFVQGMELVKEGRTALLVLAGGQGSRLKCKGPKGNTKVTYVKQKSIFQLLAEKIKAASFQAQRLLEVAIMTSPLNYVETQTFFAEHAYFGLHPKQVTFFYQQMWPLLDFEGNLFLEERDKIACGPNGNGGIFRSLIEKALIEKWEKMGIEMVSVIPIDNPLAPVFDFELFGFHARQRNDVSLRISMKRTPEEKVGVLASVDNKATIVEYTELPDSQKHAKDLNMAGNGFANLGIYCFSISFIRKAAGRKLPLHIAKKAVRMMDSNGLSLLSETPNAWKFEEFIFDVLPLADRLHALLSARKNCFAPLKNLSGEDSIDTVRAALLAFDHQVFAKVTGNEPPPNVVFELAPQFYYPTAEFLGKWRGQPFPNKDYIHE